MKELSRFELAAVKRTAQNVKTFSKKIEKLEEKQALIVDELNDLYNMRDMWEEPIVKLTGGFTSTQVLNGEMEASEELSEVLPDPEAVDDSQLEEFEASPDIVEEESGNHAWVNPDYTSINSNN